MDLQKNFGVEKDDRQEGVALQDSAWYKDLEENIIEIIKEQQVKLGYISETVRLYYPLESLNRFMGEECSVKEMHERLKEFCKMVQDKLGEITVSNAGKRFCLAVPPQGSNYVHEHMDENDFLVGLIRVVSQHGCTLEDIIDVFSQYSQHVHVEKMENCEFDYLLYFEDGVPDHFRYCFSFEACHVIYHRFTAADYEDFGFQSRNS